MIRHTIESVRRELATNPKWAERALIRLYERQTRDEQSTENTKYHNKVGFQPCDAYMMTRFARQVMGGKSLSPNQLAYIGIAHPAATRAVRFWRGRPVISKYAGQILSMIETTRA